jgi:hypothetical protein
MWKQKRAGLTAACRIQMTAARVTHCLLDG